MKQVPKSDVRVGGRWLGGEVVTEFRHPYVATTAQRRQGESEAALFAYLIIGESTDKMKFNLIKHPGIKGRKARKAIC